MTKTGKTKHILFIPTENVNSSLAMKQRIMTVLIVSFVSALFLLLMKPAVGITVSLPKE